MLELTLCLILLMTTFSLVVWLLFRAVMGQMAQTTESMATVLVSGLTTLVKPVLEPQTIPQIELETPLYADPEWSETWDGGVVDRPLTYDPASNPGLDE
jgi:hypothetical protein